MSRWVILLLLIVVSGRGHAAPADGATLLQQVANNWLDERNRWAFTQRIREYHGDTLKEERVELYDPSQSHASRWRLLSINGHPPTPTEWREWYHRKNRKHHAEKTSLADSFDFADARILAETPQIVRYELPLRNNIEWLFPVNKVELIVTINRHGPALEEVQARISEPFRVALGLERILDIDLDVQIEPPAPQNPADAKPSGTARAVVGRLGSRIEYVWSGFRRVTPRSEGPAPAE